MASMHAARLGGDKYQHLYSWWLILALKLPEENVQKVIIENGQAEKVDDVTVHYKPGTSKPDRFYQIKYHVDHREMYSSTSIIQPVNGQKSLLEKFWSTWQELRKKMPEKAFELYLISPWSWDAADSLGKWVSSVTDSIKVDEFMAAKPNTRPGKIRREWQRVLGATDEDFRTFIGCLRFGLGHRLNLLLDEEVTGRMKSLGVKTDSTTLLAIETIVSNWIISNKNEITLEMLEGALRDNDLYLPKEQESSITLYLETIETCVYARQPDYPPLDWTHYFIELDNGLRGHRLKNPADWNATLLPQLYALQKKIKQETNRRLIKVYGQARLSAWFAFGYVFSDTAGYTIDFNQKGRSWRTDVAASKDFALTITSKQASPAGEIVHNRGNTVAVGISISDASRAIDDNVRRYLLKEQTEDVMALLFLRSEPAELRNAEDANALAHSVKNTVSVFINQYHARRLLLFYRGPVGGACFIGHRLNKIGSQIQSIQIMELQPDDPDAIYAPSFLLK